MGKDFALRIIIVTGIICLGIICLCLVWNFNSKEPVNISTNNSDNEVIEDIVVDGIVEKKVDTVLEEIDNDDFKKLSTNDAAELYDLRGVEGLDFGVYINKSETEYEEIAVITMKDSTKADDIIMKISARIASLREEYKNNPKILSILEDNKNVVIKQEAGVQTVLISKNIDKLEKKLKAQF